MSGEYRRPVATAGGLRLHLNENTGGCSPAALDAIRALEGEDMAFYPEYEAVIDATAAYLGLPAPQVLLTNGLDEGLLAATVAAVRGTVAAGGGARPEIVVPLPAFDMYGIFASAVGASLVAVPPRNDFTLPLEELLGAVTPATRLVFVTSPNNPTGVRVPLEAIDALTRGVPSDVLVFVDEAYHDFCGDTAVPLIGSRANLVVGRTFAKGHGLAAVRAGCVMAQPGTLAPLRRVVPPYSLNVCAVAALRAALADGTWLRAYVRQVVESRQLVYEACDRLGLAYWPSGANFVLVRIGPRAAAVVEALAGRGIFVRDKSADPGCAGCVRVTTGIVEHTRRCLDAMEEILCGGR